jgi:hypothetical protein
MGALPEKQRAHPSFIHPQAAKRFRGFAAALASPSAERLSSGLVVHILQNLACPMNRLPRHACLYVQKEQGEVYAIQTHCLE